MSRATLTSRRSGATLVRPGRRSTTHPRLAGVALWRALASSGSGRIARRVAASAASAGSGIKGAFARRGNVNSGGSFIAGSNPALSTALRETSPRSVSRGVTVPSGVTGFGRACPYRDCDRIRAGLLLASARFRAMRGHGGAGTRPGCCRMQGVVEHRRGPRKSSSLAGVPSGGRRFEPCGTRRGGFLTGPCGCVVCAA